MPGASVWITAKEFASIVGCSRESVRKVIATDGKVRRKQLPGMLAQDDCKVRFGGLFLDTGGT